METIRKSLNKTSQFMQKLIQAGLTEELMNQVINSKENTLTKKMILGSGVFPQFGADLLKGKGAFTVPTNYKHDTQLDEFRKKTRELKSTYYYNDELTSKNFANATNKLEPGKTYAIKMFPISETVQSEDCLAFLASNNATLVGAQGLTALQNDQPEIFPTEKYTVSFDEKDALWKDAPGHHRVPHVHRGSGGDWKFDLGCFEYSWDSDGVLVCFCDLDESSLA